MTTLSYDLIWRDHGVTRGMQKLGQETEQTHRKYAAWGKAAAVAGLAVAAIAVKFGKASVQAYTEAQTSQVKLQGAFAKFPALADTNIAALRGLNTELAKKTRFDDDATASGQAVLAQFKLTGQQITQLTPLLQDYAARTGKDLPAAATTLGKAVMGNGRALKAVGIDFKDTGTEAGNFDQIVAGLRTQVGGFAAQEGKTAAGQIAILKNQFGELEEAVGSKLVPALSKGVGMLIDFVGFIDENKQVVGPLAASIAGIATSIGLVVLAAKGISVVSAAFTTLGIGAEGAKVSVKGLSLAVAGVGLALGAATLIFTQFATKQAEAKARTEGLTQALEQEEAGLKGATAAAVAKQLQDKGALADARALGLSLDDVTQAALGNADAMARVMEATDANKATTLDEADAMVRLRHTVGQSNKELQAAQQDQKDLAGATGKTSTAAQTQEEKTRKAREELDKWRTSMFKAARAAIDLEGSQDAVEAAVDDATQAVKDNGKTLDNNTAKGRDNRQALRNIASASIAYREKLIEQGASQKKVTGATMDSREAFIKTAVKMGATRKEAKELADKYGLLDKKINDLNDKTVKTKLSFTASLSNQAIAVRVKRGTEWMGGPSGIGPNVDPVSVSHHRPGPFEGGGVVHPDIKSPYIPTNVKRPVGWVDDIVGRHVERGMINLVKKSLDTGPSGSVGSYSAGMAGTIARLRAAGARSFTTYPGHHPSMAKARDVTPPSWKIANTARASRGVWYVIYNMRIASKNHGNTWRQYVPHNFRGDWQHRRHVHVAWYDRGGLLNPGGMAVNGSGSPERVLSPAMTRSFDHLVRVISNNRGNVGGNTYIINATHYSDAQALKNELVNLNRQGALEVIKR